MLICHELKANHTTWWRADQVKLVSCQIVSRRRNGFNKYTDHVPTSQIALSFWLLSARWVSRTGLSRETQFARCSPFSTSLALLHLYPVFFSPNTAKEKKNNAGKLRSTSVCMHMHVSYLEVYRDHFCVWTVQNGWCCYAVVIEFFMLILM